MVHLPAPRTGSRGSALSVSTGYAHIVRVPTSHAHGVQVISTLTCFSTSVFLYIVIHGAEAMPLLPVLQFSLLALRVPKYKY